jgi:hypothetical protein
MRMARAQEAQDPAQREARQERRFYWLLLDGTVAAPVVAVTLLDPRSQLFLLKAIAVVLLGGLPGWLYLEFVKSKGNSLYDEYVINLFRLRIDKLANLPAPPLHTSWYPVWKEQHNKLRPATKDNLPARPTWPMSPRTAGSGPTIRSCRRCVCMTAP